MSTSTQQYIIQGVRIPYKNDTYELYEDYIDDLRTDLITHHNGLRVLYDGRNGEYIVIGRIIAKSARYETIDGPFRIPDIDVTQAEMVAALINSNFPGHDIDPLVDISTWFVTHYR